MLEERYDFVDALAVATYLNVFIRHCDWVKMANLAQMVNAIAPIVTSGTGAATQPIYYPFLLHSEAALDEAVGLRVAAPASTKSSRTRARPLAFAGRRPGAVCQRRRCRYCQQ